ncbi:uncharacterized protein LOC134006210 [Scomber scombrus]|uniref:uncharacterized protein LOC134006210 n=1 Tax=Scomber scombrus TaxID=13677 RepID=UPI002DD8BC9E|nr:uncharacterized protein LOC134006210 [Scomber scombrus]XP_062301286.1 uncharacterized protein LOC134006210 [Scomber scombrus]
MLRVLVPLVLLALTETSTSQSDSGLVSEYRLFDVVWGPSNPVATTIANSSFFIEKLRSRNLTESSYNRFIDHDAHYLRGISHVLEAPINSLQEADDVRSLLQDTLKHYTSRNQTSLASLTPPWLNYTLRCFKSMVKEEPVYWLVALSARASFLNLLVEGRCSKDQVEQSSTFYKQWCDDNMVESHWMQRYKTILEGHKDQINPDTAINIFRVQMMNQKSFYRALDPDK